MSKEQLAIVEPKEYSLDQEKAMSIQSAFLTKISETEGYSEVYKQIISEEITPELISRASRLRKDLVKVRTGIASTHKVEKAFYFQAGKFVDALKNKLTLPVTQMEEKLSEIENYYAEQERLKKEAETNKRREQIEKVSPGIIISDSEFNGLSQESFDMLLAGIKQRYEDRIAAEKKAEEERIEKERIQKLHFDRKDMLLPFWRFIDNKSENFGLMTDSEFFEFFNARKDDASAYEKEQEKVRKENERLKKEAEKKEKQLELERKKQKEKEEKIAKVEAEKQAKIKAEAEAKLKKEQEAKAKLEAELKAKKDAELAEQKRIEEEEARKKKEAKDLLKSGDKAILNNLLKSIQPIVMPDGLSQAGGITAAHIIDKQAAFLRWAQEQVNSL